MIELGRFHRTQTGFAGELNTLGLSAPLRIEPAQPASDRAPDHLVFVGDNACGAGWTPESDGKTVLNLRIDDPGFPAPVRARLVQVDGADEFVLLWRRHPDD